LLKAGSPSKGPGFPEWTSYTFECAEAVKENTIVGFLILNVVNLGNT
jgi:hypothetical protein